MSKVHYDSDVSDVVIVVVDIINVRIEIVITSLKVRVVNL